MVAKEYCCYTRPYSNIEGYQRAYTLCYYASLEKEGVVLAVQRQQGGECTTEQVICPSGKPTRFVAFAGFEGANLVHNPELTQSV